MTSFRNDRVGRGVVAALAATLLVGCAVARVRTPGSSYPDDWYLMREMFRISSNHAVWHDERLAAEIDRVARRLEQTAGVPQNFVAVSVVTCPYSGAQMHPGGWIAFCLPLALRIESVDEIAFVLAHEMAHVLLGHLPSQPREYVASPTDELAADAYAMQLVARAGYAPEAADVFLTKVGSDELAAAGAVPGDVARRQSQVAKLLAAGVPADSVSRPFTPTSADYRQGVVDSEAYLVEIESIYVGYVEVIATGFDQRGALGDNTRYRGCGRLYARLDEIATKRGFSEILIHAATVLNMNCFYYLGTDANYRTLIARHVRLPDVSFNVLAALLLSVNVTFGTGLDQAIVVEMKRRLFLDPPDTPHPLREPHRWVQSYTHAVFAETCWALGSYDYDWANRQYFTFDARERRLLRDRVNGEQTLALIQKGCSESYRSAKQDKDQYLLQYAQARVRGSGNTPEQARNIADRASRIGAAGLFLNDMSALADMVNPYASRR